MSTNSSGSYAALQRDLVPADSSVARFCAQRSVLIAGAILVFLAFLLNSLRLSAIFNGDVQGFDDLWRYHIDFDVYREGGFAFANGENLYTQDYAVGGITLPFTYPPLAALFFVPFTWLPVNFGATLLNLASIAMLWWIVVLVARTVLPSWRRESLFGLALIVTFVGMWFEPVRQTLSFGQVNVILAGLVAIDLLARRTWLPRGVLVGLAAALKLTPAVFGLYFLIRKDWKSAGISVASGLGWSGFAWLIASESSSEYWFNTLHDPGRIGGLAYVANQSVRGVLVRIMDADQAETWWLLAVLVTIALVAYVMFGFAQRGHFAVAACFNSLIALLCSPVSWSHHWVWAVPIVVLMGLYAHSASRRTQTWLWIATSYSLFFFLVGMHWLFPHENERELYWSVAQQILGASYVLGSYLALVIAAVYLFKTRTTQPQQHSAAEKQPVDA